MCALSSSPTAQDPAPEHGRGPEAGRSDPRVLAFAALGERGLERLDPLAALDSFRVLRDLEPASLDGLVGLGSTHLLRGQPGIALLYAEAALDRAPGDDRAAALRVRALLRARRFDEAVEWAGGAVAAAGGPAGSGAELLAAYGSALFRVQRVDEAATIYRRVVALDPMHAEAHLRLGSGLTAPRTIAVGVGLHRASAALQAGRFDDAVPVLRDLLEREPGNPVAHRLLGEALFGDQAARAACLQLPEFATLGPAGLVGPRLDPALASRFLPAWNDLEPRRRAVAARALSLFGSRIARILGRGGRHDLLGELDRTTDAPARASLRGQRTFDGRVWDDVRGIGGLRAATGIEALDDAASAGFDTLAHEIAHQVHVHGFAQRSVDVRIRELYAAARREGRLLDYYAGSNHAEYFGQGVEAFVSLIKRPVTEPTHGHTRFELLRVDPGLHALIAELVDHDPLGDDVPVAERTARLAAIARAALATDRPEDAKLAAGMMPSSGDRAALWQRAHRASQRARSF